MSFYRWFAYIILVLVVLIPALAVSLVATEPGSRWLLSQGQKYLPLDIRYQTFHGTLLNEFQFENFVLETENFAYTPKKLIVEWQPLALLSGTLKIDKIESIQGEIRVRSSPDKPETTSSGTVKNIDIKLPLKVELEQLHVRQTRFFILENPPQQLNIYASAVAKTTGRLILKQLLLEHQYLTSEISGTARLTYPFKTEIKNDTQLHSPDYPKLNIVSKISGDIESINTKSTFSQGLTGQLQSKVEHPLHELSWAFTSRWQKNELNDWLNIVSDTDPKLAFEGSLKGQGTAGQATLTPNLTVMVGEQSAEIDGSLHYQNNTLTFAPLLIEPQNEVKGKLALEGTVSSMSSSPTINASLSWEEIAYQPSDIVSREGKIKATGPLDKLSIQLDSNFYGVLKQPISVIAKAQLTPNELDVSNWRLSQNQEENVEGSASINWQKGISLSTKFSGNYQQKPVDGRVEVRVLSPYLYIEQFNTRWGKQSLTAQGAFSPGKKVNWTLLSENLSAISAAQGSASAAGSIDGALNQTEFKVEIEQFALQHSAYGSIRLKETVNAQFDYQALTFKLSPICMNYSGATEPFCLKAEQLNNTINFQANADKVPLALLQSLALPNAPYNLHGFLSVDVDGAFNYQKMALEELSGFINADSSAVKAAGESITFDKLNIKAKSRDKSGIDLQLAAQAKKLTFHLNGNLNIAKIAADSPISGSLSLNSKSLDLLNLFLPQVDIKDGDATASLDIAGRLNDPAVSGQVKLSANRVVILPTGTLISNLQANLAANSNAGQFKINANGEVGAGDVVIEGRLNALEREGLLTIRGKDLLVLDTPSLMLMASPDMSIELNNDLISLTGDLSVPKALVTPLELNQAVTVSDDVVLKNEEKQESLLKTKVDVTVSLGENVRLEALGFAGNLKGKLQITRQPNSIARGNGRIGVVSGQYEIYGQKLTIENGDLIFNGGSLYSPSLNLRVTRNIEQTALEQDVPEKIGARVTGTIEQPELNLFSTPPLPDSTILSYLLFGKPPGSQGDVNNLELQAALLVGGRSTEFLTEEIKSTFDLDEVALESTTSDISDTSLYIGKYLTPRLYIKYGIGLLESTSTFILRYSLTENLLFESKSTTESQGGDLIYTIEN